GVLVHALTSAASVRRGVNKAPFRTGMMARREAVAINVGAEFSAAGACGGAALRHDLTGFVLHCGSPKLEWPNMYKWQNLTVVPQGWPCQNPWWNGTSVMIEKPKNES